MSVTTLHGYQADPRTIPDQLTQKPVGWPKIVPEEKAKGLAAELKSRVEGEVRFDDMSRALYSTDASNYRQVPIGVVIPKSIDDVVATIACCRECGAPFLSRGGGTSLCGQSCNAAVLVDFSKYLNRILNIDFERRLATVQPGCNLDILRNAAEKQHLTFGPDPSTHDHNTLGGMLGNNSCGVHSVMAGRTADNVESLDLMTYRGLRLKVGKTSAEELRSLIAQGGAMGEIYRKLADLRDRYAELIRKNYPKIPRRISGYNLDELLPENGFNVARALVGSEGTCVTILEATLNLVSSPPMRCVAVIGFPDIYQAGDAAAFVREQGPIGLEAIDDKLIEFMRDKHADMSSIKILPEGGGWLIAEFGGETRQEAYDKARALEYALNQRGKPFHIKIARNEHEQQLIWKAREAGLGSTAFVPHHPDAWEGWEDAAVPPKRLGDYLRKFRSLLDRYDYDTTMYGHFGDGCVHCRINFGLRTSEGLAKMQRFLDDAAALVVEHGGSISGEHGDGQSKAELLPKMFGPELIQAFREFKSIWDPDWKMNPGKVVDPYPITSNMRLGPDYVPPHLETHFNFKEDGGNFRRAAIRCVGVGKCRSATPDGMVMCPSYMVTHEEAYVTRGRARLLFEMLHGGAIAKSWDNPAVEEALDLCLSCKGCKHDCPVNVDMATYKAEFRSHYYENKLRPRAAYSMGLVPVWAQLASRVPGLANAIARNRILGAIGKFAGGIAQSRRIPPFASQTYMDWRRRNPTFNPNGKRVLLFPDTFNNYFRPASAIAATLVLEAAGWQVIVPSKPVCCGRPLYDWGMLDTAEHWLCKLMDELHGEVISGTPVVGLEPACVATFRDELPDLFPRDRTAKKLKENSFLFSEFLDRHCQNFELPKVGGKALVQIHCHHHSVLNVEAERTVMDRLGLDYEVMQSGCCGMAGSFGFESAKCDISLKAAERVMLPKVRAASQDCVIVADGFSCREQIEQGAGRKTRHLAEVAASFL